MVNSFFDPFNTDISVSGGLALCVEPELPLLNRQVNEVLALFASVNELRQNKRSYSNPLRVPRLGRQYGITDRLPSPRGGIRLVGKENGRRAAATGAGSPG